MPRRAGGARGRAGARGGARGRAEKVSQFPMKAAHFSAIPANVLGLQQPLRGNVTYTVQNVMIPTETNVLWADPWGISPPRMIGDIASIIWGGIPPPPWGSGLPLRGRNNCVTMLQKLFKT